MNEFFQQQIHDEKQTTTTTKKNIEGKKSINQRINLN